MLEEKTGSHADRAGTMLREGRDSNPAGCDEEGAHVAAAADVLSALRSRRAPTLYPRAQGAPGPVPFS